MPFNNGIHKWNNRRTGTQKIASRLDKFLLSNNAIHLGGDLSASILPLSGSDRWPISLQWKRLGNNTQRPFHFEAFWMMHPDFNNLIHTAWKCFNPLEGSNTYQCQKKLKHLKKNIKH